MIEMKSPSLAINSHDVGYPNYMMWHTIAAPRGYSPLEMVSAIIGANSRALISTRSKLLNIVINCHASRGSLYIGGIGQIPLEMSNVVVFSALKKLNIGTIWLVACDAARKDLGERLCAALAVASGCKVVASDTDQQVSGWDAFQLGIGNIDDFEGNVFVFNAAGAKSRINPKRDIDTVA